IASSLININKYLPFLPNGITVSILQNGRMDPRKFSFGLASLRLDFMPQFVDLSTTNFSIKLRYIGQFEESIRNYFAYKVFPVYSDSFMVSQEKYASWTQTNGSNRNNEYTPINNLTSLLGSEYALTD
ncbi:hypothetical protein PENTCL1PPCAC_9871, partial [Pristionchus entomophagus]